MNAEIVHVTDHAFARWRERAAATNSECNNFQIVQAVRESRLIDKNEPLPYPMPKLPNSIYTVKDDIMFILEPVTKTEFRLVTVVTDNPRKSPAIPKTKKQRKERERQLEEARLQELNPDVKFQSATEERDALTKEKERIENMIAMTPKKDRTELSAKLREIEEKIAENKPFWLVEQKEFVKKQKVEREQTLNQILEELQTLRQMLTEPEPEPESLSIFENSFSSPFLCV